jgi:hypothetical protein
MAYEIPSATPIGTLKAASSYESYQFYAVIASSSEGFFALGSSNKTALGILQNKPKVNEAGEIWPPGCVSKIVSGSTALQAGKNFILGGSGIADTTGNAGAGAVIYGPVLEDTASANDIITVAFYSVGITT